MKFALYHWRELTREVLDRHDFVLAQRFTKVQLGLFKYLQGWMSAKTHHRRAVLRRVMPSFKALPRVNMRVGAHEYM